MHRNFQNSKRTLAATLTLHLGDRMQIAAAVVGKTRAAVISGWLKKSRRGHAKRRWCALLGRTLYFSQSELAPPTSSLKVGGGAVTGVAHSYHMREAD
jgi:hypothetical protein